jgi:hypothetical protein
VPLFEYFGHQKKSGTLEKLQVPLSTGLDQAWFLGYKEILKKFEVTYDDGDVSYGTLSKLTNISSCSEHAKDVIFMSVAEISRNRESKKRKAMQKISSSSSSDEKDDKDDEAKRKSVRRRTSVNYTEWISSSSDDDGDYVRIKTSKKAKGPPTYLTSMYLKLCH